MAAKKTSSPPEVTGIYYRIDYGDTHDALSCQVLMCEMPSLDPTVYAGRVDTRKLLTVTNPGALPASDRQILMRLYRMRGASRSTVTLRGSEGFQTLEAIAQTGRGHWRTFENGPLTWAKPLQAKLDWKVIDTDKAQPVLNLEEEVPLLIAFQPPVYLDPPQSRCGPVESSLPARVVSDWLSAPPMTENDRHRFTQRLLKRDPHLDLPAPPDLTPVEKKDITPLPCADVREVTLKPLKPRLPSLPLTLIQPYFDYDQLTVNPVTAGPKITEYIHGELIRIHRHLKEEKAMLERLRDFGLLPIAEVYPDYAVRDYPGTFVLSTTQRDSNALDSALSSLKAEGWRLTHGDRQSLRILDTEEVWYSELEPKKNDWFHFELGIDVEGHRLNLLPFLRDLLERYRDFSLEEMRQQLHQTPLFVSVSEDQTCLLPSTRIASIVEKLFELFEDSSLQQDRRLAVNGFRVAELLDFESLSRQPWAAPEGIRRLADALRAGIDLKTAEVTLPQGLRATLRPYQKQGLAWLQFLRAHGVSGILADDMGLGKTVQTLAQLLHEKEAGRLNFPSLVVVPTSLLTTWVEESRAFTPDLDLLVMHGADRDRHIESIPSKDLIITTYALIRQDADFYMRQSFDYVILDEAQAIKNPGSQTTQIAGVIPAKSRLCLTGTPLENHLGELWSLFHFLLPGYLGDEKRFKRLFRDPIERHGHQERYALLNKRVAPFLLRRTKDDVAPELPSKTEIVQRVELTSAQRDLYEAVRASLDTHVQQEIQEKGFERSQIVILDALLKLRQVCCDPRLLDKRFRNLELGVEDSTKLTALMDLLPELIEEGRKILLFSQFTQMLALIEKELDRYKIPYVKLTGSTRKRKEVIAQFQEGEVPLFLISLKAGGSGLNLTAADTVIHYDPWWNPAVENQATDRAHRIGQDKAVFVYKLITQGTVEEKIHALQQQKWELAQGILSGSLEETVAFTEDDLSFLFQAK